MRSAMVSNSKKRKWGFVAGILIAIALFWNPLGHLIFSVRLALAMQNLASGATGQDLAVEESKIQRQMGTQRYEALLYQPEERPAEKALILVAGISELGCYHPRLISLARHLAERGLMVITPDIQEFRRFQITAEPVSQILFWYDQVSTLEGSQKVRRIGLAGISYSGTLALIAAGRPEIQDRVAFIVGIGSYNNLIRCIRDWFAAGSETESTRYYPTRYYGRWVVMLAAVTMIPEIKDRLFIRDVLESLLLQKNIPAPGSRLTSEGKSWYRLAVMREGQSDPKLALDIEEYLVSNIYRQLNPEDALAKVRCPVFLVHGAYDDLIAPGESLQLHRRIAHSHLLISPFLTHTHPHSKSLSLKEKTKAVLEVLVFCYQFSRIIN